jgi:23S rRNA (guanosine2251-2'-O)-methyltransferase
VSDTAFGYHAVESLIRKEPRRVAALHVQADRQDSRMQALCELSRNQGVSVLSCSKSELDALVAGRHQGVVAVLDPAVGAESAGMMS